MTKCYTNSHYLDLRVTWVCVHDSTWHQNDLKVSLVTTWWLKSATCTV